MQKFLIFNLFLFLSFFSFIFTKSFCSQPEFLYKAILNDSVEKINKVSEKGIDLNRPINGYIPLIHAVLLKKNRSVEVLLKNGTNPNILYRDLSILKHAVKSGNITAAILLVKNGADFSGIMDVGPIHQGHSQNIITFICSKFDPNEQVYELLYELVVHGFNLKGNDYFSSIWDYQTVKAPWINFFIELGADPNQLINMDYIDKGTSYTPLLYAIQHGNKNEIETLLNAGANINQKGRPLYNEGIHTPLSYAIRLNCDSSIIDYLVDRGAIL